MPAGPVHDLVADYASLSKRTLDIDLHALTMRDDEWSVTLPPGMKVLRPPTASQLDGPFGRFSFTFEENQGRTVKAVLAFKKARSPQPSTRPSGASARPPTAPSDSGSCREVTGDRAEDEAPLTVDPAVTGEHPSPPEGVLRVRLGPGANCSSAGSAIDVLFYGSVIAGALAVPWLPRSPRSQAPGRRRR
ncbi:MAG: hypothetical protein U0359_41710 [Byssovorax sp.]